MNYRITQGLSRWVKEHRAKSLVPFTSIRGIRL